MNPNMQPGKPMFAKMLFEGASDNGTPYRSSGIITEATLTLNQTRFSMLPPGATIEWIQSLDDHQIKAFKDVWPSVVIPKKGELLTTTGWAVVRVDTQTNVLTGSETAQNTIHFCLTEKAAIELKRRLQTGFDAECERERRRIQKTQSAVSAALTIPAKPPEHGDPPLGLGNLDAVRTSAFAKVWPRSSVVFDEIELDGDSPERRKRLETAALADIAEKTGTVPTSSMTREQVKAVSLALEAHDSDAKSLGRKKREADLSMVLNWNLGAEAWCWKTPAWIADELNRATGLNLTASAVKQRRDALGLSSALKAGPSK